MDELEYVYKNGGKSAYPLIDKNGIASSVQQEEKQSGLSKEEFAAISAMQGLLSNSFYLKSLIEEFEDHEDTWDMIDKTIATRAGNLAFELLKDYEL